MQNVTYVPLPNELLVRLVERYKDDFAPLIEYAVEDFLDRTEEDFATKPRASGRGYHWGPAELPHGTELRTQYYGEWPTATVENGKFVFDGKVFDSPSQVCNAMRGGTQNNAWRHLEIKRPQDAKFRLADKFRG